MAKVIRIDTRAHYNTNTTTKPNSPPVPLKAEEQASKTADEHYRHGFELLKLYPATNVGQQEAAQAFENAIAADPQHVEALFALGEIRVKGNRHGEARDLLQRALKLRSDPKGHYNLGKASNGLGLYEEAIDQLKKATRLAKDWGDAWCLLGMAYIRAHKEGLAASAFRRYLRCPHDPDSSGAEYARFFVAERTRMHRNASGLSAVKKEET